MKSRNVCNLRHTLQFLPGLSLTSSQIDWFEMDLWRVGRDEHNQRFFWERRPERSATETQWRKSHEAPTVRRGRGNPEKRQRRDAGSEVGRDESHAAAIGARHGYDCPCAVRRCRRGAHHGCSVAAGKSRPEAEGAPSYRLGASGACERSARGGYVRHFSKQYCQRTAAV